MRNFNKMLFFGLLLLARLSTYGQTYTGELDAGIHPGSLPYDGSGPNPPEAFVVAPVNDDCANATTLTPGASCVATAGTNVEATQSLAAITCGIFTSSSALDVWYKFTATATAHTITVVGAGTFDAIIDVRSGACNGTNIGCADATTSGGTETVTVGGLTVGTTYLYRVYGWAGGTGTFTTCVTGAPTAPANDDCANATTLTSSVSCTPTAGTNVNATQSIVPITCGIFTSSSALDVWYKFTATATSHTVTVVGSGTFDAIIDVRSGACNGTNIGCADATTTGGTETVTVGGLTVGTTYLFRVYGWAGGTGTFNVCVTGAAAAAPANNDCANATSLTPGTSCSPTNGTTVNATQSLAAITCATFIGTADDDVWFKFTATSTNHNVTVVGAGTFDAVVDVRTGACNGTNIGCADATTGGGTETVTLTGLTVGSTYLVRVYSFGSLTSNQGTFTICVTTPAPANDNCASAVTLTPAAACNPTNGTTVGATQTIAAITCATFAGTADDDVWYQFTATSTNHNVTVVGSAGFDAVVDVRTGACNGTNIACADATVSGGTETVTLTGLTVGATYLVRVYSFGSLASNQGTFTICVTTPAPPVPANDDCAGAVTLTPATTCNPVSGTTAGATQSAPAASCGGNPDDDIWYKFVATNTTHTISLATTANSIVIDIRSGPCNGTSVLTCYNFSFAPGGGTVAVTDIAYVVGNTYYVRLYSADLSTGTVSICVTLPAVAAPGCLANPTSPTNGQTGICPGPLTLSWPAEPTATSYDVYFGTTAVPPFVANVAGTNYAAGTLAAGTYFWQIRPRNSSGVATGCAVWSFTVGDNVAPVITCPASVTVNNTTGSCSAVVTYAAATASDNCGTPTVTLVSGPASGSSFAVGNTVITYRATDGSGNSTTCTFTVRVNDTQAPVITCPASLTVSNTTNLCGAVVNYGSVGASDNCTAPSITLVSGPASGATFPVGTTAITFRATDTAGNSSTCSFTVRVNDTQVPVITCPANLTLANTPNICGRVVAYTTPVGTDNCSAVTTQTGGLPSGSLFPVGTTVNVFRAADPAGNQASCQFQILIQDTQAPNIVCPANRQVLTDGYDCVATGVVLGLPTIGDNCNLSGPATNNAPAAYPVGTTNVTWKVSDLAGNMATCNQQVKVVDLQLPVLQCPTTIHATVDPTNGNCTAVVDYSVLAYDNCPTLNLSYNYPPLSEFPLNYTSVQVTAVDGSGNTRSCSFLVIVDPAVEVCNGLDDDCDGMVDESDDWTDVGMEVASDGVAGEQYGNAVDIDDDYAVVGSKDKNPGGLTPGAAYLLHRNGPGNWGEVLKLTPTGLDAGDGFGDAVAIDQNLVAVGAPGDDDVANNAGAVYLFQQTPNDPNQWIQILKLTLPAGTLNDNFGVGLALHDNFLVVGAVNDDQAATDAGAAYVFGRNQGGTNNWGLVKKLQSTSGASNDLFGANIDFDGEHAIVSAAGDDQKGDNAGAAYIFGKNTGGVNNWGLAAKVTASNGKAGDNFGADVGISGSFAVVGADQNDEKAVNAGEAYIFYRYQGGQANSWGQQTKLIDLNGKLDDNLGAAVGIDGDFVVVGAPGTDYQVYAQNPGKAIVYQRFDGGWVNVDEINDGISHNKNDRFGTEAAISGRTIIIGVPLDNLGPNGSLVDKGSVSFFEGVCVDENNRGREQASSVEVTEAMTVTCFPVPFNDRLVIQVKGETAAAARITMVNNLGQEVAVVYDGSLQAEGTQVEWNSASFATGMYFVRVQTADGVQVQAVNLVR